MKRKENFVKQTVAGENMLIPIGSEVVDLNGIIVLNDTANYIWDLLAQDTTEEGLVESLLEKFDIDAVTARKDVQNFLDEIKSLSLIQ